MSQFSCEEIARQLGGGLERKTGKDSWTTLCPVHKDGTPSLTLTDQDGRLLVYCHAGCATSSILQYLKDNGLWARKTKNWTAKPYAPSGTPLPQNITHPKYGTPTKSWVYRNRQGLVAGIINRFDFIKPNGVKGKDIVPLAWCYSDDGEIRWAWKQMAEPRCLYNEHRLGEQKPILIVEGEKSADAAQEIVKDEYLVMTFPGGAKATKKANWMSLRDRDTTIWPDNDEPGQGAARSIAEILKEVGAKSIRKVVLPNGLEESWDLADPVTEGVELDVHKLLRTAPLYRPQGDSVIERFNQDFALVMIGGQAVVLHEDGYLQDGRPDIKYWSLGGFKEFYGNKTIQVGKQQVPESNYWLKHEERRSYSKVIFEPESNVPNAYNLWKGFTIEPDPTGDWSLLNEHIRQNLAKGNESLYKWQLAWFASIIQTPARKSGTSLAFRGKQGTGKTIIGKAMGALYRSHYVLIEEGRYVTGQFNSHMATTLLLHCDEAFFAGDPRHISKLKGLVTSDTNRIEMKGKDSFEVNNYLRLLVTSNHDFVVPAALEERRFAIFDAGEGRMQDRVFFNAMWRQLNNGGFGGLMHYLQHMDLSTTDTDVGAIPNTDALNDQKLFSLDSVARFWFERLSFGQVLLNSSEDSDWNEVVPIETLYQNYLKRAEEWGERRRVDTLTFGKEIRKFWPGETVEKVRRSINTKDYQGNFQKSQAWCYVLHSLKAHREAFSRAIGHRNWLETEEETTGQITPQEEFDEIPF